MELSDRLRADAARIAAVPVFSGRVIKKLGEKGYNEGESRAACEWLESFGAVDDEGNAASYALRLQNSGKGRRVILYALTDKGCPRDVAERAVEELPPQDDALDSFIETKMKGRDYTRENIARATRAAAARGFDYDAIRDSVSRLREAQGLD